MTHYARKTRLLQANRKYDALNTRPLKEEEGPPFLCLIKTLFIHYLSVSKEGNLQIMIVATLEPKSDMNKKKCL